MHFAAISPYFRLLEQKFVVYIKYIKRSRM